MAGDNCQTETGLSCSVGIAPNKLFGQVSLGYEQAGWAYRPERSGYRSKSLAVACAQALGRRASAPLIDENAAAPFYYLMPSRR